MGEVNLKKNHGWDEVFFKTGAQQTLPEQLTSKWWSKQKQVIAAGKETGIGDALDELQKLFKAVKFPPIMGRKDLRERDTEVCTAAIESSQLKAFVKQLKEIVKIVKEHAGTFKGMTAKTGTALKEIGEVAEATLEVCDEAHLKDCLKRALGGAVDKKFQVIVENAKLVIEARDGVLKKIPAGLENISKLVGRFALDQRAATSQALGGAMTSYSRDMTQVIFNMLKLEEGGFELDGFNSVKASNVNDTLVQWADVKSPIVFPTPSDATKAVKALGEATKEYIGVVKPVKLPKDED